MREYVGVPGPWVITKVDPDTDLDPFWPWVQKKDPGLFTYRDLNKDPNPISNGS